jgi:acyl carrier protein|uniref:Acyl carrier protein n=1 Tax=Vaucheria litorea TaxID=109269 RepID=B7T240_VAULI|nr:acyl carrier protein [Vaucheria litorea]ACF71006.1 acyl carrier protein precursor [Vaucheria litorea]
MNKNKTDYDNVYDKIRQIVIDQLQLEEEEESKLKPEASFTDDLGADSLDIVELILNLEDKFGIEIPDEVAKKITTLEEAAKLINEKINKK